MSKDKLIVLEDRTGEFVIAWWLAEEDEAGELLGDRKHDRENLESPDRDAFECAAAYFEGIEAARATGAYKRSARDPWVWDSRSKAAAALSIIKAGISARRRSRTIPEWAKTAIAHGWKPPKGWAP